MAKQVIGTSRIAQRTAGATINSNFDELYALNTVVSINAAAAAGTFVVPAGHVIDKVVIANNTANAVTGGLKFGTAVDGAQVIAAQTVTANALLVVADADILLKVFSKTAPQTVYFTAVTAWNSATVDIRVVLRKLW